MRNDVLQSLGEMDDELGDLVPAATPDMPGGWGGAIAQILNAGAAAYAAKQQGKTERAYIKAGVVAPGSTLTPQSQGGGVLPAGWLNDSSAGTPDAPAADFFSRNGGTVLAVAIAILVTALLLGKSAR